jgi:hypothetical protein
LKLLECLVRKLRLLLGKGSGTQAKRERENGESVKGKKAKRKMAKGKMAILFRRHREKWRREKRRQGSK